MAMISNGSALGLAQVLEQHPELSSFGIGVFDTRHKTPEQRQAELTSGRAELLEREDVVLRVAAWLRENITPIKTPVVGSYHMKHVVEDAIGEYVANGELIAAALIAGYAYKYTDGPNVDLGMSKRDVHRIADAERASRSAKDRSST